MQTGLKPLGRERLWVWLLLLPTLVGLIFGAFGSVLATVGISFLDWDLLSPAKWVGLSNYFKLPDDKAFLTALSNTVGFSLFYVPLVIVLSLVVALLLNRKI